MEIFPSLIPQAAIKHQALLPERSEAIDIPAPATTKQYPIERPSYETAKPVSLSSFGETVRAPLGSIVHARSGDKANNSNVGFFVRNETEYPWLQSLSTVEKLKELLGKDYGGQRIERVEFPGILAVHLWVESRYLSKRLMLTFSSRILDFLDGGIASSARIDGLGKGVGEYVRSRHVDVPKAFLKRGCI